MFALEIAWAVIVFALFTFGAGAALAPRSVSAPLLRLALGVAFSLGLQFIVGFAGFAAHVPNTRCAGAVALLLLVACWVRRRAVGELLACTSVRSFGLGWCVFAAWTLGLLACVASYSGGTWAVDWVEHWQRTEFFLERQPHTTVFAVIYPLTARPPLANLLIALWLEGVGADFAQFQVLLALLGSLVLLPVWILARHWSQGRASVWVVMLVLMVTPFVAQNLTFAWTKLPTAFLVLTALAAVLSSAAAPRGLALSAGMCLGLGFLTHYSAAPWILAIVAALAAQLRSNPGQWRTILAILLPAAALGAVWLSWSFWRFGWATTSAANSTAAGWSAQGTLGHVTVPLANLTDTLVPFPFRGVPDPDAFTQASRLGALRDSAFNVYQVNLPLGIGLAGLWVLLVSLRRRPCSSARGCRAGSPHPAANETSALLTREDLSAVGLAKEDVQSSTLDVRRSKRFWWVLIPTVVATGVAVHTQRDAWGLAHICLQPLWLVGVAWVAAQLERVPLGVRRFWCAFAAVDFALGVALHFGLQSWALAKLVVPGGDPVAFLSQLSRSARVNASDKWALEFHFVSDRLGLPPIVPALWLALVLGLVIFRVRMGVANAGESTLTTTST